MAVEATRRTEQHSGNLSEVPAAPVAALSKVQKRYPKAAANVLDAIDLDVASGEFLAIIGSSGAGKTTLLNVLGCVDRPSAGTYRLEGVPTEGLDDRGLAALRANMVGFVFQNYHLIDHLTVRQNLEVRFLYQRRVPENLRGRVDSTLDELGILALSERFPRHLSGGEMQRVAVARALVGRPRLLLADEPTGNLDRRNSEVVFELLAQASAGGTAVVMVTHDESLAQLCPRRLLMKNGRLVTDAA